MLDFPITDSHLHLWDTNKFHYAWLSSFPQLNDSFGLSEFNAAANPLLIQSMVFVQAECAVTQALEEVNWITSLAKQDNRLQGIVAYVPLEKSAIHKQLVTLQKNPLVKGIRRLIQSESDMNFCLQPEFIKNMQLLADFNFTFDICINANQLPAIIQLVKRCPQTTFILDHMGKPMVAKKELLAWQENISLLASYPNVWCKVSGLITEANLDNWCLDDLKPYLVHVINAFGIDRLLFGSDWPVMNLAGTYQRWIKTLIEFLQPYSRKEMQKFFSENANTCYRLSSTASTERISYESA